MVVGGVRVLSRVKLLLQILDLKRVDNQLDQASQHRTTISHILHKSYLVHSVFDAAKTLASFLTNVADWNPTKVEQALDRLAFYNFLEDIIAKLTSRAVKTWQIQFKASKHICLTILINVQMIVG